MGVYPNELLDLHRVAILQVAIVLIGLIAGLVVGKRLRVPVRIIAAINCLAARPWLPPLAVGIVGFLGAALVATTVRWPVPSVHDEFGYLLIADTFRHGRLSNPTLDHWEHFEAIHMLMRPTYQSKYPPGPGAMIALGLLVSNGKAAVGLWLGIALACAATTWLLQALVEPRWAMLGGLITTEHFSFFGLWSQTYWGGATAMLGGALMFGAAARLARDGPTATQSAVLAVGLFILSFTRPYEGLVASLPVGAWLLHKLWRWYREDDTRARAFQVLAVQLVAVALLLGAHATYNRAVTGSSWRMPYQEYQRQYSAVPEFIGSGVMQPERQPARFQTINRTTQNFFESRTGRVGLFSGHLPRVAKSLLWLCSLALLVPTAVGLWQLRRLTAGPLLLTSFLLTLLATSLTFGVWSHYYAPVAAMFVACATVGLRTLWRSHPFLRALAVGAVFALLLTIPAGFLPLMQNTAPVFGIVRDATIREIRKVPGRHLVLVVYSPQSNPFCDWVFNGADIPNSRIIWATSLGDEKDAALIAAHPDRNLWVYDADAWGWRVRPEKD